MHRHMQRLYIRAPSHTYTSTAPAALARAASGGGSGAAPQWRQGHTSQITQGHPCAAAGGSCEVGGGDTAIRRPRSLREVIGELHGEVLQGGMQHALVVGLLSPELDSAVVALEGQRPAHSRRTRQLNVAREVLGEVMLRDEPGTGWQLEGQAAREQWWRGGRWRGRSGTYV